MKAPLLYIVNETKGVYKLYTFGISPKTPWGLLIVSGFFLMIVLGTKGGGSMPMPVFLSFMISCSTCILSLLRTRSLLRSHLIFFISEIWSNSFSLFILGYPLLNKASLTLGQWFNLSVFN